MYKVKEIYYTIQGEGFHSGRAAVFCRFSGCNLWSGREEDRSDAVCRFCDTNFWGTDGTNGGKYSVEDLVRKIDELYDGGGQDKFVVLTGNMDPQSFVDMDFAHRYVQAMESEDWQSNIDHAVDFVKKNPQWRLSVQTHKNLGID